MSHAAARKKQSRKARNAALKAACTQGTECFRAALGEFHGHVFSSDYTHLPPQVRKVIEQDPALYSLTRR